MTARREIAATAQGQATALQRATAIVPGTCGELVQGVIGGRRFHVTCPIDLYAATTVTLRQEGGIQGPQDSPKAARALETALAELGMSGMGAEVEVERTLPRGKGMASSTADVAGAIVAVYVAAGAPWTPTMVARLAVQVEPSDGVMFPGIVLFDHRDGAWEEDLGGPPAMSVAVLDFGGVVDTLAWNASDMAMGRADLEASWAEALALVRAGLAQGDAGSIGAGATLSAMTHARMIGSPHVEAALAVGRPLGAAGVCMAHSGTVLGLLFAGEQTAQALLADVGRALPAIQQSYAHRIVSGGVAVRRNVDRQGKV